jgi:hypothetical protein
MLTGFLSAYRAEGLLKMTGNIDQTTDGADCSSSCFLGGMQLYILGRFKSIEVQL